MMDVEVPVEIAEVINLRMRLAGDELLDGQAT
jgi:hypothetical protein